MFVLLHVVALKDKLAATWESNGLSFKQYVYTSCGAIFKQRGH